MSKAGADDSAALSSPSRRLLFILYATAAGSAAALSYTPQGGMLPAAAALTALFYLAWKTGRIAAAAALGLAFGFAFFLAGLWWVYSALTGHIGLPVAGALTLTVVFCLALAAFPAAALALAAAVSPPGGLSRLLALAACWTLAEWLRGWIFTGFPWLQIGYSQIPGGWLAAWAPITGILGVTLALALTPAALLGLVALRRIAALPILIILPAAAPLINNVWQWVTPAGTLTVSLLQGNVKQSLKWEEEVIREALRDYLRLADSAEGRVIILPETALPMRTEDLPGGYLDALRALADERSGAVIVGLFEEDESGIYNAALALEKDSAHSYRKAHLTPYGEYLPFEGIMKPLLGAAGVPYSSLSPGASARPLPLPDGMATAISICYEDIFGNEWRAQAPEALFLTNITNDAWFDNTIMPAQHLQISQARALETGRWLVRATNTGITAIINRQGNIVARLPEKVRGVLTEEIVLYRGMTPYVLWGDKMAAGIACLILLGVIVQRLRRRFS